MKKELTEYFNNNINTEDYFIEYGFADIARIYYNVPDLCGYSSPALIYQSPIQILYKNKEGIIPMLMIKNPLIEE